MTFLRVLAAATLAAVLAVGAAAEAPPVEAATEAGRVIGYSKTHLGKPYLWGAIGLRRFDCSGLVYRVFNQAGALGKIGGRRATARWYYRWLRDRGRVVKTPRVGDLVAWGRTGVTHIGIYVGRDSAGRPVAISAVRSGVKRHLVRNLTVPFKAYLRVNRWR